MAFVSEHIIGAVYLNSRQPTVDRLTGFLGVFVGLRDVMLATVGTSLLYMVVFLSTRKMRKKIPYEVWRYLHWFVYLGIMLEFVHQMTLGIHFLNGVGTKMYWIGIHVFVLGCVAW